MKKSEKDALKQKIQSENILVRRLGSWVKVGGIIFLVTAGLCVWGFTGMKDPILPVLLPETENTVFFLKVLPPEPDHKIDLTRCEQHRRYCASRVENQLQ